VRLDRERNCYREAEMIVRTRLHLLQAAFADTLKAIVEPGSATPAGRP
jgi:hypothetical protein